MGMENAPEQLTAAKVLKALSALGGGAIVVCLVNFMVGIDCPADRYPPIVLGSLFLSLAVLFLYTHFRMLSRGLLQAPVQATRLAFAAVVAVELTGVGLIIGLHRECDSVIRIIPLPAVLVIFYTGSIFALVYGDAYLGVLRRIVRLGRKPIDFMNDRDLEHK